MKVEFQKLVKMMEVRCRRRFLIIGEVLTRRRRIIGVSA